MTNEAKRNENTVEPLVRLIFPLLRRKDGEPRRRQPPVSAGMNGHILLIARGVVVHAPAWVQSVCDGAMNAYGQQTRGGIVGDDFYECFVSHRKPNIPAETRPASGRSSPADGSVKELP